VQQFCPIVTATLFCYACCAQVLMTSDLDSVIIHHNQGILIESFGNDIKVNVPFEQSRNLKTHLHIMMSKYHMSTEMNDTSSSTITVSPRAARSTAPKLPKRVRQPKMILVVGETGVGKSSFVTTVSGNAVGIGHDLRSCQLQ
jgi:transcriptional regulator with PAS, ATPase and Fis domain